MTNRAAVKSAFETMLFVLGEPLAAATAGQVFDLSEEEAKNLFHELQREYDEARRGIRIREMDGTFQFCTDPENAGYIGQLLNPAREQRLSQAAMEVLAIVAYRQPVTRTDIEAIRGIKCDRALEGLLKKELIVEVGRGNGIGRPILYGTTRAFLGYLGLRDLTELPPLADVDDLLFRGEEEEGGEGPDEESGRGIRTRNQKNPFDKEPDR